MSGGVIASALTVNASEEKTYSNVLDDLKKDSRFDAAAYPDKPDDVSVQLIQIAESEDGQLFMYVYQPADSKIDLKCISVSISVGFSSNGQGLDPKLYDLILLSSEGVFDKYLVNGFELPDAKERYYNIVSLYREFNAAVDPESDKTEYKDIVCKSYSVGQQWCAYTVNNARVYEMNTFKTVDLEIKLSSTIKVNGGIQFGNLFGYDESVESHYVAFKSNDYNIKHIYDATVFCRTREYEQKSYLWGWWEGDRTYPNGESFAEEYIKLSDKEAPIVVEAPGLWSKEYSFNRIMSAKDFKQNVIDSGAEYLVDDLANLSDDCWVFSYYETDLQKFDWNSDPTSPDIVYEYKGTEVEGYILQIKFMDISGDVYDLGVVADGFKSTGTSAENGGTDLEELKKDLNDILTIILGILGSIPFIIAFVFFWPFIKEFAKLIWFGVKCGFKFIVSFLTYPLRLLYWGIFGKK